MSGFQGVWSVGIGGAVPAPSHPPLLARPGVLVPADQTEQPGGWQESSGPAGCRGGPSLPLVSLSGRWVCGDGGGA